MTEEVLSDTEPTISPASQNRLKSSRYFLFVLVGLLLLAGAAYGGYWYGKVKYFKYSLQQPQTQNEQLPTLTPTPQAEERARPAITPEKVTENFYKWYLDCINGHFQSESSKSPREDCPYQTNEYTSFSAPLVGTGFDPVLCAQDTPNSFAVGKAEISKDQALVTLTEEWSGPPRQLTNIKIELRLINNQWKITNIICPTP